MTGNWKPIGKLAARLAGLDENEEPRQRANAPGHDLKNLTLACKPCNRSKRDKTPEEWVQ